MRSTMDLTGSPEANGRSSGVTAAVVLLVLVVLTKVGGPVVTAALGTVLTVGAGLWLGRSLVATPAAPATRPGRRAAAGQGEPKIAATPVPGHAEAGNPATALQVRWWRRGGHDRLYVSDASGKSLGWLDRDTGRLQVLDERDRAVVEGAGLGRPVCPAAPAGARGWLAAGGSPAHPQGSRHPAPPGA